MLSKKTVFIFFAVLVVIFSFSTTVMAQDVTFKGEVEFDLGVEFGLIIGEPAPTTAFNWGFFSTFKPETHIFFDYTVFTGNEEGYYAVTTGIDFQLKHWGSDTNKYETFNNAVANAYANFYDIFGIGNNFVFNFTNQDEDYWGQAPYVAGRAIFNIGKIVTLQASIIDYLNSGISDATNGNLIVDGTDVNKSARTEFEVSLNKLDLSPIVISGYVLFGLTNTTGFVQSQYNSFFNTTNQGSRWDLEAQVGMSLSLADFMILTIYERVFFSERSLFKNKAFLGIDIAPKSLPGLKVNFKTFFKFAITSGTTIVLGEGLTDIDIAEVPFAVVEFPIYLDGSYLLSLGSMYLKFGLTFYMDLYDAINQAGTPPQLPWYVKVKIAPAIGTNGVLEFPLTVKLTSIPLNDNYDFEDWSNMPPAADNYIRLIFGLGVACKF